MLTQNKDDLEMMAVYEMEHSGASLKAILWTLNNLGTRGTNTNVPQLNGESFIDFITRKYPDGNRLAQARFAKYAELIVKAKHDG
jgi:hypothetical protein